MVERLVYTEDAGGSSPSARTRFIFFVPSLFDIISVIYEDDSVIVFNKPAFLAIHEDGRSEGPFLTDYIREKYSFISEVGESMILQNGEKIFRPGIVHRLDKDTSGVLIVAKNQDSFFHLKKQFQNHTIEKEYRAFVYGKMEKINGTIDVPIGRSKKDFRLWSAGKDKRGKLREALTRYTTLFFTEEFSYLSLSPKTGRTHQLRVHLKHKGHPIVADSRYAPKKEKILGFSRLALHAHSLSFENKEGVRIMVDAPFPADFLYAEKSTGKFFLS